MTDAPNRERLLLRARESFGRRFERPARYAASAPGRVNLIGEHVDYNDGFVLPIAIARRTVIVADRAADRRVHLISGADDAAAAFELDGRLAPGEPPWANYVKGVLAGCLEAGFDPGGFDALIESDVPIGAGLSSSAALEVAAVTLVEALCGRPMAPQDKALLCQRAEHEFPGVPCGIMDQFISVMGRDGCAMLLDCRSRRPRMVAFSGRDVQVVIADTTVKHELAAGEYARRQEQCRVACAALGVASLRDATIQQVDEVPGGLDPLAARRARHVISEIGRTQEAAEALAAGDWHRVGRLMNQSHASLRDDYEVSCRELDVLVELAQAHDGVLGSRMTGAGFGGATVSLVRAEAVEDLKDALRSDYRRATGMEASVFDTRAARGAQIIEM